MGQLLVLQGCSFIDSVAQQGVFTPFPLWVTRGQFQRENPAMTTTINLDELLNNTQVAELLGIKPNTLEIWRHRGVGPNFIKLGRYPQAPVRYLRSAISDWLALRSFRSTSDYSAQSNGKPQQCGTRRAS